jgi:hypothetical protein
MTLLHNLYRRFVLTASLFVFFSTGFIPSASAFSIEEPFMPDQVHAAQSIKIVNALERYHYLEKRMDDDMSADIFDRYLKQLDPGKRIFTAEDIKAVHRKKETAG